MAFEEKDFGDVEGDLGDSKEDEYCICDYREEEKEDIESHTCIGKDDEYSCAQTMVFWNLDDYPIPTTLDYSWVFGILKSALLKKGLHGPMRLRLFGCNKIDHHVLNKSPGTCYIGYARDIAMQILLELSAGHEMGGSWKVNAVVMAKAKPDGDNPQVIELDRVLHCLKSRNHTLLLIDPSQDNMFSSVEHVSDCIRFICTSKPSHPSDNEDDSHTPSSTSKAPILSQHIQDFSVPIPHKPGLNAAFFWDLEDYPFQEPEPQLIYKKIEEAVVEQNPDLKGKISVWAYADEKKKGPWNKFVSNKTWEGSLYFLPGGNKSARRERMLHDIQLWSMDTLLAHELGLSRLPVLVVILDQVEDHKELVCRLALLKYRLDGSVFLMDFSSGDFSQENPDWARSTMDRLYPFERVWKTSVKRIKLEESKDESTQTG